MKIKIKKYIFINATLTNCTYYFALLTTRFLKTYWLWERKCNMVDVYFQYRPLEFLRVGQQYSASDRTMSWFLQGWYTFFFFKFINIYFFFSGTGKEVGAACHCANKIFQKKWFGSKCQAVVKFVFNRHFVCRVRITTIYIFQADGGRRGGFIDPVFTKISVQISLK